MQPKFDVYFGSTKRKVPDWRLMPSDNSPDDDEELAVTPPDVVGLLGFDPLEFEKENPNHDELGRFAEGPGGGESGAGSGAAPLGLGPTPDWKTSQEARSGLYARHGIGLQDSTNAPIGEKALVEKAKQIDEMMTSMTNDMPGLRECINAPGGIIISKGKTVAGESPEHGKAEGLYRGSSSFSDIVVAGSLRSGDVTSIKGGGWTLSNTFNGILRHEIGHSIQDKVMSAMRKAGGMGFDPERSISGQLYDANKSTAAKKLSMYGASNHKEYWAESFAAYSHPAYASSKVRIDPRLEKAFDAVLKRKGV